LDRDLEEAEVEFREGLKDFRRRGRRQERELDLVEDGRGRRMVKPLDLMDPNAEPST
jgi:hypothetical protein